MDSESLLEFVDQGGDLLLAVDAKASDELRGLVADLGVDLEKGHQASPVSRIQLLFSQHG